MKTMRVLVVDDSEVFLAAAVPMVNAIPGAEVIGVASSGAEALRRVTELRPDLVLMDIGMPGMNGLVAAAVIKAGLPPARVIMVTLHDLPAYRKLAADLGADGFVSKRQLLAELAPLIQALARAAPPDSGQPAPVQPGA